MKLDWSKYYDEFVKVHGEPVRCRGRLVFADGYSWPVADPAGPEFRPPSDPLELAALQRDYFATRLKQVLGEAWALRRRLNALVDFQSAYSLPLQTTDGALDLQIYRDRLQWLESDAVESKQRLAEFEDKVTQLELERAGDAHTLRA